MDIIAGKWDYKNRDKKSKRAFMKKRTAISTWATSETLSTAAAHFFVMDAQRCIAEKGRFVVALSGGNTPRRLFQLLATVTFSRNIDWEKVFLFWSDERFVAHTDADSNYRMAKENLLDHIPVPGKNIFPVPVEGTAKECAARYESSIRKFFKKEKIVFDWLLLGIGEDGHTASLFPGNAVLQEKKKLIREVWAEHKQSWRVSFTLPLINKAANVVCLVSGKEKADIVSAIINRIKIKPLLPAQLLRPVRGTLFWMLDAEAAAKI
jgi:6-phosphogluconolactonase